MYDLVHDTNVYWGYKILIRRFFMNSAFADMMKKLPRSEWEYGSQYDSLDEKFAWEREPKILVAQPCACCHEKKLRKVNFKLVVD